MSNKDDALITTGCDALCRSNQINLAVKTLQRRYLFASTSLRACKLLTIIYFATGGAVLFFRELGFSKINYIEVLFGGFLISIIASVALALRQSLPRGKCFAIIDGQNNAGGVLMAQVETEDYSWNNSLKNINVPHIRTRLIGRLPGLFLSIIFVVSVLFIPAKADILNSDPKIELENIQKSLKEQIEALKRAEFIDRKSVNELKKVIEQIVQASEKDDPSKTFEALHQLREKLRNEVSVNLYKMLAELESLKEMQKLNNVLKNTGSTKETMKIVQQLQHHIEQNSVNHQITDEVMKELYQKLQNAVTEDEHKIKAAQAVKGVVQALQNYIQQHNKKVIENFNIMNNACLIDQKNLKHLMKEGKLQSDNLTLSTAINSGHSFSNQSETAPLDSSRVTTEQDTKFRNSALPVLDKSAPKDSVTIGVTVSAPQIADSEVYKAVKQINWSQQRKQSLNHDMILPKHRNAIRNYFKRTGE